MTKVIVGDITFYNENIDGYTKAVIHSGIEYNIDDIHLDEFIDNQDNIGNSWLVPALYNYPIDGYNNVVSNNT